MNSGWHWEVRPLVGLSEVCLGVVENQFSMGRRRAFPKPVAELVVQHVEEQKPQIRQVSKKPDVEVMGIPPLPKPPSWEPKLGLQSEPTITFLFTLLNTSEPVEPNDSGEDLETPECPFLEKDDWGPRQTAKEMRHLKKDCMRLWESLNIIRMENLVLGEKLQNLPNSLYKSLKKEEAKAVQEGAGDVQEGARDVQEGAGDVQDGTLDIQGGARDIQEGAPAIQEEAQAFQKAALLQVRGQRSSGIGEGEGVRPVLLPRSPHSQQQPCAPKATLLILLPDPPHNHRNQCPPWPGPSLETTQLLGRPQPQLLSESQQ
ncbi:uncharacterized protein LOC119536573 [Choloepus didactylus]|uniref:uncharacterized protein LOC119536573 n=1 Tax=Choloepus didactylus TaxID=27675 RepID=UPI00189D9C40|nr:uncharacterized protein LOC119536573 [Choloepus didactylus]